MGIQVGDNFDHKSKKPLDNRTQYATLAAMKAVTDANIPEGCEAYCVATDKYYKFLSSNTVDSTTGKWRERESGGASTLTDLTDTTISSPSNGQVLAYDSATSKWKNSNASGGASALNDLSDVTISSATSGQVLKNNGSGWVNGDVPTDNTRQPKTLDTPLTIDGETVTSVEYALRILNEMSIKQKVEVRDITNVLHPTFIEDCNMGATSFKIYRLKSGFNFSTTMDIPYPPQSATTTTNYDYYFITTKDKTIKQQTGETYDYKGQCRTVCYVHYVENNVNVVRQFIKIGLLENPSTASGYWYEIGGATSSVTSGSTVPITSGGTYDAFTTSNSNLKDSTPTSDSQKPLTSGGAYTNCYITGDTAETALADADYFPFYDTSATKKKKTLWSNVKSILKTYFDTLYSGIFSNASELAKIGEQSGVPTYDGQIISLPTVHNFDKANLYSTTEQVIGKWINEKPLYQKTINLSTTSVSTGRNEIDLSSYIGSVDYLWLDYSMSSLKESSIPISSNYAAWGENNISWNNYMATSMFVFVYGTTPYLILQKSSSSGTTSWDYVTVRYTKSTDAANSFNYASENDYSTSETIVGTWVDGKTLYQKTYTGTTGTTTGSVKTIGTITSTYKIKSCVGGVDLGSNIYASMNYCTSDSGNYCTCFISNGSVNVIAGKSDWQSKSCWVTVQYTKS